MKVVQKNEERWSVCLKNGEKILSLRWYKISLWSTEIQMHVQQGMESIFVFSFSKNVFYPSQSFLCLDSSPFFVEILIIY